MAGGSYLINGIQSTGLSFGLERIASLAKISIEGIKCLVISVGKVAVAEGIKVIETLRKNKISCFLMEKITKGLEYANKRKIPYVVFVGKEELKQRKLKLRNMKTGKEKLLTLNSIIKILKH